jgi:polyisoprenoid-binding protein YceI
MKTLFAAAVLATTPALAVELQADPAHSAATFSVKHMMVTNVRGEFRKVAGTVNYDAKDPTKTTAQINIDASTIDTRNEKRDGHLKSPDFFDVAKCPEITFKSTKVEKAGDKHFKVTGDLTMHCVTKPVVVDVQGLEGPAKSPFPGGGEVYSASATTRVNRKDFGLNWNKALESGGVLVGDDVDLSVDLELSQPAPAKKEAAK